MSTRQFRVWIDSSERTHVVCCSLCKGAWVYLDKTRAEVFAKQHRTAELGYLRGACIYPNCVEPAWSAGLCRRHDNRARYQSRKAAGE